MVRILYMKINITEIKRKFKLCTYKEKEKSINNKSMP